MKLVTKCYTGPRNWMDFLERNKQRKKNRRFTKFLSENLKGRDHVEDLGRRWEGNIRIDIKEVFLEDVNWMHLTENKDQWWSHKNKVQSIRVPYKAGNFLTEWLLASKEGSYSMVLVI